MSKRAEEAALKAYPELAAEWMKVKTLQPMKRAIYKQGYEQAEKDLDLSWEDIWKIVHDYFEVDFLSESAIRDPKTICEEVLRRFNEYREKKTC